MQPSPRNGRNNMLERRWPSSLGLLTAVALGLVAQACLMPEAESEPGAWMGDAGDWTDGAEKNGGKAISVVSRNNPPPALGRCEGDCDQDSDCRGTLKCLQRNGGEPVPGCGGGTMDGSKTDYCYDPAAGIGSGSGSGSNTPSDPKTLYVRNDDGNWLKVACEGSQVVAKSNSNQTWSRALWQDRALQNDQTKQYLYCPELGSVSGRNATNCRCDKNRYEYFHFSAPVSSQIMDGTVGVGVPRNKETYIGPNSGFESCLKIVNNNRIHSPCNPDPRKPLGKGEKFKCSNPGEVAPDYENKPCSVFLLTD